MAARKLGATHGTLEERLIAEIEQLLGRKIDDSWSEIGSSLKTLHSRFVSEAPLDPTETSYLASKSALAAYLSYFFLSSAAQVRRSLVEVSLPDKPTLRVLDIGSGPGPAAAAVAEHARSAGKSVEVVALEAAPLAVTTMRNLWDPAWGTVSASAWKAGQPMPEGPFDVIVVSHVLNELFLEEASRLDRRVQLAAELGKKLSKGGLLLLLEPALKRTARELLVVRDRLLTQGFVALAPCFYQGACPAIARPRDWCHADRPWKEPALVEKAGQASGLSRDTLKFAYVVLSNVNPNPTDSKDASLFRIVSEPLPEKGKLRFFGCGPSGRHPLVRLDKDSGESNALFDGLQRGDIIRAQGLIASGDGKRVNAASTLVMQVTAADRDRASES
jgi:ribosomal protein RSM22 (predicted rRNA methylase)